MMLPIVTATANTGVSETAGSGADLLSAGQLPQDFVQLLALHLPSKQASDTLAADSVQSLDGKDNKQKLLDALNEKGIDLGQQDLNALLASVDALPPFNDKSLSEFMGSLRKTLIQRTDGDVAKETQPTDSQAIQALMAMLSPAFTQPQQAAVPTLSNAGLAASMVRTEKAVTDTSSLFGLSKKTDGASTTLDELTSTLTQDKSLRATPTGTPRQANAGTDGQSTENTASALTLTHNLHEATQQDVPLPTHTLFNATPNTQTSITNHIAQPSATAQLNAQLGTAQWQDSLGQQIIMLSRNGQQSAQLRLHPEELGTLHISLRLDDNQAQIHLASANSQVRNALEAALPHLRSAMAESGINLGQSSVGSENSGWQQAQQQMASTGNSNTGGDNPAYKQQFATSAHVDNQVTELDMSSGVRARPISGVDIFA